MLDDRGPALVAVIDNDEIARTALCRVLQVGGVEPALFDRAKAVLASRPKVALLCLIMDVQLAGLSGLDLQMRLCSEGSEVPVFIITGDHCGLGVMKPGKHLTVTKAESRF